MYVLFAMVKVIYTMNKIVIAGSRSFNDYKTLSNVCNVLFKNISEIEIVCGEAYGADKLGRKYAEEHNLLIKSFPANWDKYGKSAGYIRNKEMAKYCDNAIIFWDGVSKGSNHMIKLCKEFNKDVLVYNTKTDLLEIIN